MIPGSTAAKLKEKEIAKSSTSKLNENDGPLSRGGSASASARNTTNDTPNASASKGNLTSTSKLATSRPGTPKTSVNGHPTSSTVIASSVTNLGPASSVSKVGSRPVSAIKKVAMPISPNPPPSTTEPTPMEITTPVLPVSPPMSTTGIESNNNTTPMDTKDNTPPPPTQSSANLQQQQSESIAKLLPSSSRPTTAKPTAAPVPAAAPAVIAGAPSKDRLKLGINDLQIMRTLGTGSFGRVHLVKIKATGEYCAMKALRKSEIVKLRQIEHTINEKSILEQINMPFIVNMVCTFQDMNHVFIVMEYISGGELFSYLRKAGRFPAEVAKFYAAQVLLAFEHLHSKDIIYRDLKPENLLLDNKGNIKVTDFGFAKHVPDQTWTLCGTPDYLAPEVIQSKGYGKAVDWWALGILIYEMISGHPPFFDDDHFKLYEKIINCKLKFPPFFDPIAKDMVKRLLTPDLTKRYGNLKDGVQDIKRHKWFHGVNWELLLNRGIPAPFVPKLTHAGDTSNFDTYPEDHEPYGATGVDKNITDLPEKQTIVHPDGNITTIEYRLNDEGKKVKVTRKTTNRTIKIKTNKAVAERKKLSKFGESKGLASGPDSNSTSFGEYVSLKMGVIGDVEPVKVVDVSAKLALKNSKIMCRICKGEHWTSKCSFKDTHAPLDAVVDGLKDAEKSAKEEVASDLAKAGKYVPPSLRGGRGGEGESMSKDKRDDYPTIRITNLSPDVKDNDVRDLVSRFGSTARVFVAKDYVTGQCKGFAFVSFYMKDDADMCMKALNGFGYDNLILSAEIAIRNENK